MEDFDQNDVITIQCGYLTLFGSARLLRKTNLFGALEEPSDTSKLILVGDHRVVASAIQMLHGTLPLAGMELQALSMIRTWGFELFTHLARDFFERLLSVAGLIHFDYLVAAASHITCGGELDASAEQLLDELAVLVDPRTVRRPFVGEDVLAYNRAFVLARRIAELCYGPEERIKDKPRRALSPVETEMDALLEKHRLSHYRDIFFRTHVAEASQAVQLSARELSLMNVLPADALRIQRHARTALLEKVEQEGSDLEESREFY